MRIATLISILVFVTAAGYGQRLLRGVQMTAKNDVRLYPFEQSRKWGYYDANGTIVIKPQFHSAAKFQEGVAAVAVELVERGRAKIQKYGYIASAGKFVIAPKLDFAGPFSNGLAAVRINGNVGYIDKTGSMVIRPQYDVGGEFSDEGA